SHRGRRPDRELALIEIVDRLFITAALLRDSGAEDRIALELAANARELAANVGKRLPSARAASARSAAIERLHSMAHGEGWGARVAQDLARGWRMLEGRAALSPPSERPPMPAAGWLGPLAAALHPQSVAARHALRFALLTAAAVVVFWFMPPPFGFWVPLTV